jgi:hypothetical protein
MDELSDDRQYTGAMLSNGVFAFTDLTRDDETGTTTAEFDPGDGVPSMAVTALVADRKGVDPRELAVVYDIIDPDALDSLFRDHRASLANAAVTFQYEGFDVRISHGSISITESD